VLVEHPACRRALQRFVERAAREAERGSGHGGAEHIERAHRNLEPRALLADALRGRDTAARKAQPASGCGAMTAMRSAIANPGAPASTMKAEMPREPFTGLALATFAGVSPVRANTT